MEMSCHRIVNLGRGKLIRGVAEWSENKKCSRVGLSLLE